MENLIFTNENDRNEFLELIAYDCLKEINEYNNFKIYIFDLDVYYEAFTFDNKNNMIDRQMSEHL